MKNFLRLVLIACLFLQRAGAFDLPNMYRVPFFQTDVTKQTKDWTTSIDARFAAGQTRKAFGPNNKETALFNANGAFDMTRLGLGLNAADYAARAQTNVFWGPAGTWANLNDTDAGLVEIGGRFKTTEIDLELKQNVMWGFYAHVFAPYKELHLDTITTKVIKEPTIAPRMAAFMANSLPTILTENGFTKPLTEPFKKHDFGDISVSVGWQKYKDGLSGLINTLGGFMQIGVVLPVAPRIDQNIVFSVPLGYDKHIGVVTRAGVQATLWKMLTVGGQAGSIIFIKENRTVRMITDKNQNGLIVLGKGRAGVDRGSLWDVGGYVKADQFVKGFAATIGASFTKQESTILEVKDDNFLKTAIAAAAAVVGPDRTVGSVISANDVVNADSRLNGWETYALHFVAAYDAGSVFKNAWAPFVQIEYDYPIFGTSSWTTDMISGTAGLRVSWNF